MGFRRLRDSLYHYQIYHYQNRMFILDDLLLGPFKGLYWIGKEIHEAVLVEQTSQREAITTALSELYMELETGRIDEAEFDAREAELLDTLDQLQEPSRDVE